MSDDLLAQRVDGLAIEPQLSGCAHEAPGANQMREQVPQLVATGPELLPPALQR